MLDELSSLNALGDELARRARARGAMLIWRAQTRAARAIVLRDGRAESVSVSSIAGQGIQVVTEDGYTALASRDGFEPEESLRLLDRCIDSAAAGSGLNAERCAPLEVPATRGLAIPATARPPDVVDPARATRRLAELESEIASRVPDLTLQLSYRAELEGWRIRRSDGTDVTFAMPRCRIGMRATGGRDGARHGVSASVFDPDPELLWHDGPVEVFLRRAERAARLARALPDAPAYPAGSYPLVIDYGLAKGLAHEAFGHASEADGFRSSILARDGRFLSGELVGAAHVSIIDEPVPDDHAWQPFSANGETRQPVRIVDHGRLHEALADPWSAGPGGVRPTGAARAETFRHAPQPRMTNIRIELDDPLPAPGAFEDYGPEEVRELLSSHGVLARHPQVAYLSGYTGGQVNSATGDFVFNCSAIWELSRSGIRFHRPAIFSGSMFGALQSVREGFGPLQLDATGYCGKWGQSVPSSGGSHYFLVLDPDPGVRLGGR